jgi:dienelactone hydrolase
VRSGLPGNDEIRAELFTPDDPSGVVIQLPHWKEGPGAPGQRLLALGLAARGFAVLILPLPYQHERAPDGVRSGKLTLSHDLARTRAAALQGVADVARAGLWLERKRGFPPERQAVLGVSLGGHVGSLALGAHPDRFGAGVFLLTASGIAETLFTENGITDGIRSRLEARGVTATEAADLLEAIDPARHARPDLADRILLVAGTDDPVAPRARVEALAKAWGGARVQWFEGGHYGMLRHLATVLAEATAHIERRFKAP